MPFTPPKPIEPPPDDLRGARVLVVDDERAWRVILETDLRMLGYSVAVAHDAAEALKQAESHRPDVAIIDLMLPEPMDGWALLSELKTRGIELPVIFYSAYPVFPAGDEDSLVVGYMSKAVDRADLYALLPKAVRRVRRRHAAAPAKPKAKAGAPKKATSTGVAGPVKKQTGRRPSTRPGRRPA